MPKHFCVKPYVGGIGRQEFFGTEKAQLLTPPRRRFAALLPGSFSIAFVLSLIVFCAPRGECGFRLEPSRVLIMDVPPGEKFQADGGADALKIYNDEDVARSFKITLQKPAEAGAMLMFGYVPVPKPGYIMAERGLEVGPGVVSTHLPP